MLLRYFSASASSKIFENATSCYYNDLLKTKIRIRLETVQQILGKEKEA